MTRTARPACTMLAAPPTPSFMSSRSGITCQTLQSQIEGNNAEREQQHNRRTNELNCIPTKKTCFSIWETAAKHWILARCSRGYHHHPPELRSQQRRARFAAAIRLQPHQPPNWQTFSPLRRLKYLGALLASVRWRSEDRLARGKLKTRRMCKIKNVTAKMMRTRRFCFIRNVSAASLWL